MAAARRREEVGEEARQRTTDSEFFVFGSSDAAATNALFRVCHRICVLLVCIVIQCPCSGWPTGSGKKLSRNQAQLGQATCLAVA